jgi:mannose-6-phosphate isomerase-like protein (cupin superfamily)
MPDVTVVAIDEMETFSDGLARRARAALGVTAWGMQVMTLPPHGGSYPHRHDATAPEPGQEEVYIPLAGSAQLVADGERFELRPGLMVRVGPDEERRIEAGADGIRFIALGGVPGRAYSPLAWTELGGPVPEPPGDE